MYGVIGYLVLEKKYLLNCIIILLTSVDDFIFKPRLGDLKRDKSPIHTCQIPKRRNFFKDRCNCCYVLLNKLACSPLRSSKSRY